MGRHSIPDHPGDSSGEEPEQPSEEEPGYDEPEFPESAYDRPEYREAEYPGPSYGEAEYEQPEYRRPDYPEPEYREPSSAIPPPSTPQHSGGWEGGEWTGSHRAVSGGRRGVSLGVIAALVTVVVVVAGVILWRFFGDALSNRTEAAAARCVDGESSARWISCRIRGKCITREDAAGRIATSCRRRCCCARSVTAR